MDRRFNEYVSKTRMFYFDPKRVLSILREIIYLGNKELYTLYTDWLWENLPVNDDYLT